MHRDGGGNLLPGLYVFSLQPSCHYHRWAMCCTKVVSLHIVCCARLLASIALQAELQILGDLLYCIVTSVFLITTLTTCSIQNDSLHWLFPQADCSLYIFDCQDSFCYRCAATMSGLVHASIAMSHLSVSFAGVPAKRQHPYQKEASQSESRQTRKMTRSASLGSNMVRNQCAAASAPAKKEPVELQVSFSPSASTRMSCACFCKCYVSRLLVCWSHCWSSVTRNTVLRSNKACI